MARLTFGWFPDTASENTMEPAVNVTKYGDGYEARISDTLNVTKRSWSMTFTKGRLQGEGQAISAFLKARHGVEAFDWIDPMSEPGVFVCRKWSLKTDRGEIVIRATFEEVFEQ